MVTYEEMGVIDNFDKRLDLGSLGHLFLTHRFRHFQWVTTTISEIKGEGVKE